MWKALKETGIALTKSRKFVVLAGSALVYLAARAGFNVPEEDMQAFIVAVTGYLVGQGIADTKKPAV